MWAGKKIKHFCKQSTVKLSFLMNNGIENDAKFFTIDLEHSLAFRVKKCHIDLIPLSGYKIQVHKTSPSNFMKQHLMLISETYTVELFLFVSSIIKIPT